MRVIALKYSFAQFRKFEFIGLSPTPAKIAPPPQSIHGRTPFSCRFGPFCSVPRMQDYQQSGFIEYEKDSIRFYGYAPSLLLHKRQRSV